MQQIEEVLAESFIAIFYNDFLPVLDDNPEWQSKIEELNRNNELNAKSNNLMIAEISANIELSCYKEKLDINGSLNLIAQNAYLYSRAFESKIGSISDVFFSLVENYNNNRA